jgi:hypothetical protein
MQVWSVLHKRDAVLAYCDLLTRSQQILSILIFATVSNDNLPIRREEMNALRKEAFFDRLSDEVDIKNVEQLRTIVVSQVKEAKPTKLSLALEGGEVRPWRLRPP